LFLTLYSQVTWYDACASADVIRNKPVGDVVRSLTYLFSGLGIVGKNLLSLNDY